MNNEKVTDVTLKNSDMLWHYTSSEVLWKMLEGHFYASHYRFMNDSAEFLYGIKKFNPYFIEFGKIVPYFATEYSSLLNSDFFLFCFSALPDSLYQWRSYTPQGGYSIGFSRTMLKQKINDYMGKDASDRKINIKLLKCRYSNEIFVRYFRMLTHYFSKLDWEHLGKSVSNIKNSVIPLTNNQSVSRTTVNPWELVINSPETLMASWFTLLPMTLMERCYCIKNPTFSLEQEFRLILTGHDLRKDVDLIGLKPRVKIPLPELNKCIKKIYVSPHGDVEQNILLAKIARDKFGLNFEIHQSESSFNGK